MFPVPYLTNCVLEMKKEDGEICMGHKGEYIWGEDAKKGIKNQRRKKGQEEEDT